MKKYVVYLRQWLKKSPSRVELTTQEIEAERFVAYNGGRIIATYTDREGKHERRTEFPKAVQHALSFDGVLVIAHLGRLARNVPVTRLLLDSHVDFVCLDDHDTNPKTIHIIANMAEEETRKMSDRYRKAMQACAARGVKFASARPDHWKGREHLRGTKLAIAAAAKKKKEQTKMTYAYIMPEIKARRERGETLPQIVEWLNSTGHVTTAGKPFTQTAVWRLIDRYLGKEWLGSTRKKTGGSQVGINKTPDDNHPTKRPR